jgi:2,3-diaminopropionate biosynthesis protein SbnB
MSSILYLSHDDVTKCDSISFVSVTEIIRNVFKCHYEKDFILPDKVVLRWGDLQSENTRGRINSMPAYVGGQFNSLGFKWIGSFPKNRQRGLPRATAVILLNDTETGLPVAIMEGSYISAMRTAAVNLVASDYLCIRDPKTIAIIGTGVQNRFQLSGFLSKFNSLEKVKVYNRTKNTIQNFIKLFDLFDVEFEICDAINETTKNADIIISATTSSIPLIKKGTIEQGATYFHFSGNECEYDVINEFDKIYVDDWNVIMHRGNLTPALMCNDGVLGAEQITGNLGQLIVNEVSGRQNDTEKIIFCAMGMAIEDVAVASAIYNEAVDKNIGTSLRLWDKLSEMVSEEKNYAYLIN